MAKQFTVFFVFIFTINVFSQTSFVKGYFINNSNKKIDCFIKNEDWLNNPTKFKYKNNLDSEVKTLTINDVKEFGIVNTIKFQRYNVNIDKSGNAADELDYNKNPVFNKEKLFLKLLIEGKANLYYYENKGLVRYFFSKDNAEVKQLVFKSYLANDGYNTANNNEFRRQLWVALQCESISMKSLKTINYRKSDLVKFFIKYNECSNSEFINYQQKKKNKDSFNLTLRPGIRSSSLVLNNPNGNRQFDFGKNLTSFRLGLEAEFIFGFHNNKWAFLLEPIYHELNLNTQTITFNQKSIEVNFGVRHYMYLKNKNVKLFVNALVVYDNNFNSQLKEESSLFSVEMGDTANMALGIGCKYKKRFGLELRYLPSTNFYVINSGDGSWDTDSQSLSIVLGYSIF